MHVVHYSNIDSSPQTYIQWLCFNFESMSQHKETTTTEVWSHRKLIHFKRKKGDLKYAGNYGKTCKYNGALIMNTFHTCTLYNLWNLLNEKLEKTIPMSINKFVYPSLEKEKIWSNKINFTLLFFIIHKIYRKWQDKIEKNLDKYLYVLNTYINFCDIKQRKMYCML